MECAKGIGKAHMSGTMYENPKKEQRYQLIVELN